MIIVLNNDRKLLCCALAPRAKGRALAESPRRTCVPKGSGKFGPIIDAETDPAARRARNRMQGRGLPSEARTARPWVKD